MKFYCHNCDQIVYTKFHIDLFGAYIDCPCCEQSVSIGAASARSAVVRQSLHSDERVKTSEEAEKKQIGHLFSNEHHATLRFSIIGRTILNDTQRMLKGYTEGYFKGW